jgi:hypothetical protein
LDPLAGQFEENLVGGAEECATLFEIDILDGEVVVTGRKFGRHPLRRQRLPGPRWAVD